MIKNFPEDKSPSSFSIVDSSYKVLKRPASHQGSLTSLPDGDAAHQPLPAADAPLPKHPKAHHIHQRLPAGLSAKAVIAETAKNQGSWSSSASTRPSWYTCGACNLGEDVAKLRAKDDTVKAEFHAMKMAMIEGTAKDHRRILESFDILGQVLS